jgi:hypothetical protein
MRIGRLSLLFVIGLLVCGVMAQNAPPKRTVVTRTDGTTVAGQIEQVTPAAVTVRPGPKAEPVVIVWKDIKRVGDGTTRAQVIETWRKDHPEQLCESCHGAGTADCGTCKGTGVAPATATECEKCEGSGKTGKCTRCKEGQMPCPAPCLKAESFSGKPDAEGKRWRTFKGKSGTLRISDAHVGELVVMENGDPSMKGKCPTCDGTTRVTCTTCHGTGDRQCATCHGKGVAGPKCADCDQGHVDCATCSGSGMKASEGG